MLSLILFLHAQTLYQTPATSLSVGLIGNWIIMWFWPNGFLVWSLNLILGLRHHGKSTDHDSWVRKAQCPVEMARPAKHNSAYLPNLSLWWGRSRAPCQVLQYYRKEVFLLHYYMHRFTQITKHVWDFWTWMDFVFVLAAFRTSVCVRNSSGFPIRSYQQMGTLTLFVYVFISIWKHSRSMN